MPGDSGRRPRLLLPVMSMSTSATRAGDSRCDEDGTAYLLPLSDNKQAAILLQTQHTTIGRAADCEVVLGDPRISRQHATITGDGQHYHLRDAGSLNGTFVNGRRVLAAATTRLQTGDELRFADLRFRFLSGPAGQSHTPLTTKSARPLPSLDRADLVSHPDRLRFDDVAAEVYVGAGRVVLAPKEYALLRVLWRRAGHVCSKECLAQAVWPECQGIVSDASIESTVSRLRRKLAAAGGRRAWVQTVPRRGYRLVGDEK